MNIFQVIGNWFKSIFSGATLNKFKDFAIQVFQAETPIILGQLSEIALQVVGKLNLSTLTSADKRAEAFKQIADFVKTNTIPAFESDINLAIEMAVKALKNNVGNAGFVTGTDPNKIT